MDRLDLFRVFRSFEDGTCGCNRETLFMFIRAHIRTLLTIAVVIVPLFAQSLGAANYYVEPVNGSDSNPGTLAEPWKTIQHAAIMVDPGDNIVAMPGEYREQIQTYNSGAPQSPITFVSYKRGEAVVKCSDVVSGWEQYDGSVYRALIDWVPYQVFANDELGHLARHPDPGEPYLRADSGGQTYLVDLELDQPDDYWTGAILRFASDPNEYTRRMVSAFSGSAHRLQWVELIEKIYNGSPYWLEGLLSEVTVPGEWFYDPATSYLYFHFGEQNPEDVLIEVSKRMNGFLLRNVEYINISGFDVRHGNATFGYGGGIYLENSSFCEITNNLVTEALSDGIFLIGRCDYNLVEGNDSSYNGRIGIYLYSEYTEGPSSNTITGNIVAGTGTNSLDGAGIAVTNGNNNIVSNNIVTSSAGSSITFVGEGCVDNVIESNEIFDSSVTSSDRGAVSVFGSGGGNLVKSNLVVDTWGWDELQRKYWGCGIIIDKTDGEIVFGNLVSGSHGYGINIHKSARNYIFNNTCVLNGYLLWHTQFVNEYDSSEHNFFVNNLGYSGSNLNVFAVTEGAETATGNWYNFNCWYREGSNGIIRWADQSNYTLEQFRLLSGQAAFSINEDPRMMDPAGGDYRILPDSPCRDSGFDLGEPYLGTAPDMGAFEFGLQPPLLSPIGDLKFYAYYRFNIQLEATDPDGGQLWFFATGLPPAAKLKASSGILSWRPKLSDVGKTWNATFYVSDGELYDSEDVVISAHRPILGPVFEKKGENH